MIKWASVRVTPLGYVYQSEGGRAYTAEQIDLLLLAAILGRPGNEELAADDDAPIVALIPRDERKEQQALNAPDQNYAARNEPHTTA